MALRRKQKTIEELDRAVVAAHREVERCEAELARAEAEVRWWKSYLNGDIETANTMAA